MHRRLVTKQPVGCWTRAIPRLLRRRRASGEGRPVTVRHDGLQVAQMLEAGRESLQQRPPTLSAPRLPAENGQDQHPSHWHCASDQQRRGVFRAVREVVVRSAKSPTRGLRVDDQLRRPRPKLWWEDGAATDSIVGLGQSRARSAESSAGSKFRGLRTNRFRFDAPHSRVESTC